MPILDFGLVPHERFCLHKYHPVPLCHVLFEKTVVSVAILHCAQDKDDKKECFYKEAEIFVLQPIREEKLATVQV